MGFSIDQQTTEWNGVCACGKIEQDGVTCRFGATHKSLRPMAQEVQSFPWTKPQEPSQFNGRDQTFPWSIPMAR